MEWLNVIIVLAGVISSVVTFYLGMRYERKRDKMAVSQSWQFEVYAFQNRSEHNLLQETTHDWYELSLAGHEETGQISASLVPVSGLPSLHQNQSYWFLRLRNASENTTEIEELVVQGQSVKLRQIVSTGQSLILAYSSVAALSELRLNYNGTRLVYSVGRQELGLLAPRRVK